MTKSNKLCLYESNGELCVETTTGTPVLNSNQDTLIKSNQVTVHGDIEHNSIFFTKEYSDLLIDITGNKSYMVIKKWAGSAVSNEMRTIVENVNQITEDNLRNQDSPFNFNNWVKRAEPGFSLADAEIVSIKDVTNNGASLEEVILVQGEDKPIDAQDDGKDVLVNLRDSAGKTAEAWNLLATTVLGQKIQSIVDDLVVYLRPLENTIDSGLDYNSNFTSQVPQENFSVFGGSDAGVSYLTFMDINSQIVSFGLEMSNPVQAVPVDEKWTVVTVVEVSVGNFNVQVREEFGSATKDLVVKLVNFVGYASQLVPIGQLVLNLENKKALNQLKYGFDSNNDSKVALESLVLVGGNIADATNGIWNEVDAIKPAVDMNVIKSNLQTHMDAHYSDNAHNISDVSASKTDAENTLVSAGTIINTALDSHENTASTNTQTEVNGLNTTVGTHITTLNVDIGKANNLILENKKLKEDLDANLKNIKELKHLMETLFGKSIDVPDGSGHVIDLDNLDSSLTHSNVLDLIPQQQSYLTSVVF